MMSRWAGLAVGCRGAVQGERGGAMLKGTVQGVQRVAVGCFTWLGVLQCQG